MQSLYRRYRPDSFTSVIGQDHIVKVLRNQVITGQVSHAYLFTGTRGTGKTSVAKIFARAVNCERPIDGSPCEECDTCKNILNSYDIIELDAASNNGADAIRGIQESVKYPPTVGKYKVYIIDEVHMLSVSAFNALLKTLEEPPSHVVFILATTEIHQLPQTVLSRCLKLDFRLVPSRLIADRVRFIFNEIGQKYTDEAIIEIAEAGDGSVRDALSVADMCVSYSCGETLEYDDVLDVLGSSNPSAVADIAKAILEENLGESFKLFDALINSGKSVQALMRDLAKIFRNIYIATVVDDAKSLLNLPEELYSRIKLMSSFEPNKILGIIDTFTGLESKMRFSSSPRIVVEAAIARATSIKNSLDMNALTVRVKALENELEEIKQSGIAIANSERKKQHKTPIAMDKTSVLGELLRTSRDEKRFILHQALRELRPENIKIDEDKLTLEATSMGAYRELNQKANIAFMLGMLMGTYIIKEINIVNAATKEGIDNGVMEMKRLFDNDILFITKQKSKN